MYDNSPKRVVVRRMSEKSVIHPWAELDHDEPPEEWRKGMSKGTVAQSKAGRRSQEALSLAPWVSIDVGYGYTKVMTQQGQTHVFPSLVAPAELSNIDLSLSDPQETVKLEGAEYIVGQSAVSRGFRFTEEYDGWWMTTRYKALLHYAGANFVPPGSRIVTGIPLHVYGSTKAQQQISEVFRKALKASAVAVLPQGFGALCLAISVNSALAQGRVALVDIGTRTTELICFSDGQYLHHESTGVVLGVGQVYAQVAQKLSAQHQRQIDAYEVDWALREEKPIKIKGGVIERQALEALVQHSMRPLVSRLQNEMTRLWKEGAPGVDHLLYCGGGSSLLAPYLGSFRDDYLLLPESQFTNAAGYLEYIRLTAPDETHAQEQAAAPAPDPLSSEPKASHA